MSGVATLILVVAIVVVIAAIVVVAVVLTRGRRREPVAIPDPPYDRRNVADPTVDDPQVNEAVDPADVRHVDGPDNYRNPGIDQQGPGPATPRNFPPAGPPRE